MVRLECYKAANPNGATLAERSKPTRVGGRTLIFIRSSDTVETFLRRIEPKVTRNIGGVPGDWHIQLKVEGDGADWLSEFATLDLDGDTDDDEKATKWLWRTFLDELSDATGGDVHVSTKPTVDGKSTQDGKGATKANAGGDVVKEAGPKLVTRGQSDKAEVLLKTYRCTIVNCPHRHIKDRSCWRPYWDPSKHMLLDFKALSIWAMAWDRGEASVNANLLPKLAPFTPSRTASTASSSKQDGAIKQAPRWHGSRSHGSGINRYRRWTVHTQLRTQDDPGRVVHGVRRARSRQGPADCRAGQDALRCSGDVASSFRAIQHRRRPAPGYCGCPQALAL
ncbi:hypothetical protein V8E36_003090 [Tilletia maclaganii]